MRTTKLAFGLVGLLGLSLATAVSAVAQGTTYTTIERGRYLVNAGDCASCHTGQTSADTVSKVRKNVEHGGG